MMRTKVIGICGTKGSGKSTLARYLEEKYKFQRRRFADPIKLMLSKLLEYQDVSPSVITRMLDGDFKEYPSSYLEGHTPRHAMQTLGTEWRNMISQEFYSNVWRRGLVRGSRVVADDLRFPHEEQAIREQDGIIIKISRPNTLQDEHISEQAYKQITPDVCLENNGTLGQLFQKFEETFPYALRSRLELHG